MDRRYPLVSARRSVTSLSPTAHSVPRRVAWRQLLPSHRLPVIAKTPLIVAMGVYLTGGRFDRPDVWLTLTLATLLWTALYALNEMTDLEAEHGLHVDGGMKRTMYGLCGGVCVAGLAVSPHLAILFGLMSVGQIGYCAPPLRWKRYWWAALLLSGGINPILRLQCGVLLGPDSTPPLYYAVFVVMHEGAAMRSRALLRTRDRRLGYHTAPDWLEAAGMTATALGFAGAFWFCWRGVIPLSFAPMLAGAALFAIYAWSGRAKSVETLRKGWLLFAVSALIAVAILFLERTP